MKRMTAIVLALVALLAGAMATAESGAARLELEHFKLTPLGGEDDSSVRLYDMGLTLAVGGVNGAPTLQATLDYGDGQQLESAIQLDGTRLLLSLGGISGTYSVDMAAFAEDEAQSALTAAALRSALMLFSANPELALDMLMPKNEKGVRYLSVKIPRKTYLAAAKRAMDALARAGVTEEDLAPLRQWLDESKKAIKLTFKYDPQTTKLRIRFTRAGKGIQLKALMNVTSEPMDLIDPSADPVQRDLLGMSDEERTELRDELDFLAMKYDFFAEHTRLARLAG